MAGDLKNNLTKLTRLLKEVRYPGLADLTDDSVSSGNPVQYVDLYRYLFTVYSQPLLQKITEIEASLSDDVADAKFIEHLYRIMRDVFDYKPRVPKDKFLKSAHAAMKVVMATEIVVKVKEYHKRHAPKKHTLKRNILSNSLTFEKTAMPPPCDLLSQSFNPQISSSFSDTPRPESASSGKIDVKSIRSHSARIQPTKKKQAPKKPKRQGTPGNKEYSSSVATAPSASYTLTPSTSGEVKSSIGVKVVISSEKARQEGEQHKQRAMNMLGKTPVRPGLQSNAAISRPAAQSRTDQEKIIESLQTRVQVLEDKVQSMEEKYQNMKDAGSSPSPGAEPKPSHRLSPYKQVATLSPSQVSDVMALIENALAKKDIMTTSSPAKFDENHNMSMPDHNTELTKAPLARTSTLNDLANVPSNVACITPLRASVSPVHPNNVFDSPTEGEGITSQSFPGSLTDTPQSAEVTDAIHDAVRASVSDTELTPPSNKPGSNSYQVWMTFASLSDSQRREAKHNKRLLSSNVEPEESQ